MIINIIYKKCTRHVIIVLKQCNLYMQLVLCVMKLKVLKNYRKKYRFFYIFYKYYIRIYTYILI